MSVKKTFKSLRDGIQKLIYVVINPLVYGMVKVGITPNIVTTIGFLGNILSAVVFVYAAQHSGTDVYYWIGVAGGILVVFSLFDMLDGQVARLGNMTTVFGAMYDSVLDRYSELVTLGGIFYFLMKTGYEISAIVTFVALVGSLMVSYVRARAEGLGLECKIGFMQRPERVVVTFVSALACGIYGCSAEQPAFDPIMIVSVAMGVIALFANVTAFARIAYCRRELSKK